MQLLINDSHNDAKNSLLHYVRTREGKRTFFGVSTFPAKMEETQSSIKGHNFWRYKWVGNRMWWKEKKLWMEQKVHCSCYSVSSDSNAVCRVLMANRWDASVLLLLSVHISQGNDYMEPFGWKHFSQEIVSEKLWFFHQHILMIWKSWTYY